MPVKIEGHTVAYFKAPIYAKLELWGLKYGGTLDIQTGLLNICCLLHKMGFVQTENATTVIRENWEEGNPTTLSFGNLVRIVAKTYDRFWRKFPDGSAS